MPFRLEVLSSFEGFCRIRPDWDTLAASTKHPMNTGVWYEHAGRFVHSPTDRIHIITIWNHATLEGVAPLILTGSSGRLQYEIIGTRVLYEPAAILARSERAAEALSCAVASLKHPVTLTRVVDHCGFNELFRRRARRAGFVFSPGASGSPYVELNQGWDTYYESRPSRLKNVIRRGNRQLCKMGRVQYEFVRPQPDEVREMLLEAFEVERRSWKGRNGSAVLLRSDLREFFFHYAEGLARRDELLICFLRFDGAAVATQVANVSFDAYWQLKIGYDERYAKQLVGLQLQLETLKWACQQGLRRYEFLGTAEPWIREWTDTVHAYRTTHFYPFNLSGFSALCGDNFARIRGRVQRRRQRPA